MPTGHQPHVHTAHTASHRRRLSHHARSNSSTSLSTMGAGKGGGRSAGLGMTAAATTDERPGRRRKSGGESILKPSPSHTDPRARSSSSHRSRSSHRRSSSSQQRSPFAEDPTTSSPPANGPVMSPPASESEAAPSPALASSQPVLPEQPPVDVLPEQPPVDSPAPASQPLVSSPSSLEPVTSPSRPGQEAAHNPRYPKQLRKASSKSSLLSLVTRPNLLPKRLSSLSAHPSLAAAPQISTEAALSSPTISRGSEGLNLSDGTDERTAAGHLRKASFGSFNSAAPLRGRAPSAAGSIRSDRGGVLGSTVGGGGGSAVDSLTALRSTVVSNTGRPESGMPRRRIASSASTTSLADLAEGVKRSVFSSFYNGSSSSHPNRAATSPDDATTPAAASRPSQIPKPPPLVKSHFIRPSPSANTMPKNPVLHPSPFLDAHTSLLRGMQAPGRDGSAVDGGRTPMGMSIRRCLLLAGDTGPPNGSSHGTAATRRSAVTSIVSAR